MSTREGIKLELSVCWGGRWGGDKDQTCIGTWTNTPIQAKDVMNFKGLSNITDVFPEVARATRMHLEGKAFVYLLLAFFVLLN